MKHIFIINPAAGKKDSRQRVYTMAEALKKKHNLDVECMLTKSRGHATALTRAIAETGDYVRFYACGGDGTVNEIANGIAGFPNAAMTCIPIGTGNDFLKNFGKDAEPLFLDAENLWNGDVTPLDLIDCNGKYRLHGHRRAHRRERARVRRVADALGPRELFSQRRGELPFPQNRPQVARHARR